LEQKNRIILLIVRYSALCNYFCFTSLYKQHLLKYIFTYLIATTLFSVSAQDYLNELTSIEDYNALASIPLSNKYSNVGAVKVIYDLENEEIYFTNSRYFKYHYDFCSGVLGYKQGIPTFNENNYGKSFEREYFLATINHYRDANIFTFEFSTSDVLGFENIAFYNKVKELFLLEEKLNLFPSGFNQIDFMSNLDPPADFVKADYIYKNINYQALNQTFSYGRLHIIDMDTFTMRSIDKNDIVLINGTPIEMPLCRGIITTDFQPPLSHIVILSHNRRTPIMALKNAWTNKDLFALNGMNVKLVVESSNYSIGKTSDRATQNHQSNRDRKRVIKLPVNYEINGIQSINSLSAYSTQYVGGKAANYGELNRIYFNAKEKLQIPKAGFALPFYHYLVHCKTYKIDSLISELFENEELKQNVGLLDDKLKEIRKAIKKAPLDEKFLNEIENLVLENGIERLRFRSSTNAEDIKGFNGAGLYDSKTGILGDEKKTIEKAIKKVWASLWNLRAFQEREFFKIDQSTVAMGVLVHQSFPNEEANGVAITKNIYRPERIGFIVNAQKGDVSLVLPPLGVTSEQFVIKQNLQMAEDIEIDYISYSSLNEEKPILSFAEVKKLNRILATIKLHFYKNITKVLKPSYEDFAMDVEFKIEENTRKIIVKQARIY
jgi:pyruvate,water dikinase